jgi:hypothetical protein
VRVLSFRVVFAFFRSSILSFLLPFLSPPSYYFPLIFRRAAADYCNGALFFRAEPFNAARYAPYNDEKFKVMTAGAFLEIPKRG